MRPFTVTAFMTFALVASVAALPAGAWARGREPGRPPGAIGTTLFVDATAGDDGNTCTSATTACRTIRAAIDKSGGHGVIHVAPGTYAESISIGTTEPDLAIVGAGSGRTTVDAGGTGRTFACCPGQSPKGSLSFTGVTLQNGSASGLWISPGITLTLSDVVLRDNACSGGAEGCVGGALDFYGPKMILTNVTFTGNQVAPEGVASAIFFAAQSSFEPSTLTQVTFEANLGGISVIYVAPGYPFVNVLALDQVTITSNFEGFLQAWILLCGNGFAGVKISGSALPPLSIDGTPDVGTALPQSTGLSSICN